MSPQEFLVEEYKQLYKAIENCQNHYTRLENFTFGGALAAYGFLLLNKDIPAAAWAAIPAVISIAAARCLAFYWIINGSLAVKIMEIEDAAYEMKFVGYQKTLRPKARRLNIIFNAIIWAVVILGSLFAFVWRVSQPPGDHFVSWPWPWPG